MATEGGDKCRGKVAVRPLSVGLGLFETLYCNGFGKVGEGMCMPLSMYNLDKIKRVRKVKELVPVLCT
jgi:hypothetical protein